MIGRTIDELSPGDTATITRTITPATVREYVTASGDANPIHSDPAFAATTRFGQIIAPGMLTGGLVSAVIGTLLPGPGAVYLSQDLRFLRPVHIGDVITARVELAELVRERNRMRLRTVCVNQHGDAVLEGEAWVMAPKEHIKYDVRDPERIAAWALAWTLATFGVQVMSFGVASALLLTNQALQLYGRRAARRGESFAVRS